MLVGIDFVVLVKELPTCSSPLAFAANNVLNGV